MRDYTLTDNNDLYMDDDMGDTAMTDGEAQAIQKLQIALGTNRGELDWNPDFGLDHSDIEDNAWDLGYVQQEIDDYLTDMFAEVDSVEVEDANYDPVTRNYKLSIRVFLADGDALTMNTAIGGVENDYIA